MIRQNNSENKAGAKTKERVVFITPSLSSMIQAYINTERYESGINGTNYLFINLFGNHKGQPFRTRNFLRILKDAGEVSSLPRSEIRTHSGRSTRAQQLVELMEEHPELGITETFIIEELGWSSIKTLKVYRKGYSKN
ncbi:site-specific integrase [Cohnella faecalis]|uniref:Site-specific integrase n=1 Tax=Cohnella faecalis TaxID=2315694 RepID=A0A398CP79_9BACL|nr:site-specific integrase [Cohnella faecalis]